MQRLGLVLSLRLVVTIHLVESAYSHHCMPHERFGFAELRNDSFPECRFEGARNMGCNILAIKPKEIAFLLGIETLRERIQPT